MGFWFWTNPCAGTAATLLSPGAVQRRNAVACSLRQKIGRRGDDCVRRPRPAHSEACRHAAPPHCVIRGAASPGAGLIVRVIRRGGHGANRIAIIVLVFVAVALRPAPTLISMTGL